MDPSALIALTLLIPSVIIGFRLGGPITMTNTCSPDLSGRQPDTKAQPAIAVLKIQGFHCEAGGQNDGNLYEALRDCGCTDFAS